MTLPWFPKKIETLWSDPWTRPSTIAHLWFIIPSPMFPGLDDEAGLRSPEAASDAILLALVLGFLL